MPLSALVLVVLAGLIHASWNIAAKKAGGDVRFVGFTSVVMMLFWAPVGLWVGWPGCWGFTVFPLFFFSSRIEVNAFIEVGVV